MSSTAFNLSLEDLTAYSARLHVNTILTVITNGLAIFLILKHSTKAMGRYRFYILFTCITALIMDLHLTVVYSPFPLFPLPAFCGTGIMQGFGWFWGASIHYVSDTLRITIVSSTMNITLSSAKICHTLIHSFRLFYTLLSASRGSQF